MNKVLVFSKGAPEIVIDYCSTYFDKSGNIEELNGDSKQRILKEIVTNSFAKKAYRTILIAYSEISKD
jgi:magnesium-transporting ATPase (P-type)